MSWATAALGDVATIDRKSVQASTIAAGSRYVGLEHIESGGQALSFASVANGELASSKFKFTPNHILFGKLRPYLAKIVCPDFEGICSTDILPIQPSKRVDKRYLLHFLKRRETIDWASNRAIGINLPRLSPKELETLEIPLPPLDEQRRIAAILDKADALHQKRKHAIALLDSMTQAVFLEMFGDSAVNPHGYRLRTLREICEKVSDGPFGSNLKSEHYVPSGIRVIRLQNIGSGLFHDEDQAFVSEEHYHSIARHTCLPGDVLIGTLGEPNLRACLQPEWLQKAINKADCVQARVNTKFVLAEYLVALLNLPSTETMAQGLMLGQTRTRISMGRLRDLPLPVAPVAEQSRFVSAARIIKSCRESLLKSLDRTDALFTSLQSRAFSGQL